LPSDYQLAKSLETGRFFIPAQSLKIFLGQLDFCSDRPYSLAQPAGAGVRGPVSDAFADFLQDLFFGGLNEPK
jgi:hypothetical protein